MSEKSRLFIQLMQLKANGKKRRRKRKKMQNRWIKYQAHKTTTLKRLVYKQDGENNQQGLTCTFPACSEASMLVFTNIAWVTRRLKVSLLSTNLWIRVLFAFTKSTTTATPKITKKQVQSAYSPLSSSLPVLVPVLREYWWVIRNWILRKAILKFSSPFGKDASVLAANAKMVRDSVSKRLSWKLLKGWHCKCTTRLAMHKMLMP